MIDVRGFGRHLANIYPEMEVPPAGILPPLKRAKLSKAMRRLRTYDGATGPASGEKGMRPPASWCADSDVKPAAIPIKDRPPFRFEAGQFSALNNYLLGQQLWHQSPRDERGHFDAGKEKADHETIETNAAACRKRDELPRDCGRIGDSAQYGAG